ncbi:MAG: hypothetical protein MJK04_33920, partial [Psychrosphaera sp.]|nr:hypothetical protein [Psychrosphaera sp.]
ASTYAVGTVFVKHFESGGSLLSIDMSSMTTQVKSVATKYKKDKQTAVESDEVEGAGQVNESANGQVSPA